MVVASGMKPLPHVRRPLARIDMADLSATSSDDDEAADADGALHDSALRAADGGAAGLIAGGANADGVAGATVSRAERGITGERTAMRLADGEPCEAAPPHDQAALCSHRDGGLHGTNGLEGLTGQGGGVSAHGNHRTGTASLGNQAPLLMGSVHAGEDEGAFVCAAAAPESPYNGWAPERPAPAVTARTALAAAAAAALAAKRRATEHRGTAPQPDGADAWTPLRSGAPGPGAPLSQVRDYIK